MAVASRDGVQLSYELTGDGEPIVLISGFAADSTFWAGMLPTLAARYRLVCPDPRGPGRSGAPDLPGSWCSTRRSGSRWAHSWR